MNCHNFENVIDELARGSLMEAATRENALGHAEECARCSARLTDERALTEGMHALAAQTETLEAPARAEAALLAAFRERRVAAQAPSVSSVTPLAPVMIGDAHIWWMPRWAQGAAAAAAAVVLVVALYGVFKSQSNQTMGERAGNPATPMSPSNNAREEIAKPPAGGNTIVEAVSGNDATPSAPASSPQRESKLSNAAKGNYQLASYNPRGRRPAASDAALNAAQAPQEVFTDYIPLMNGGRLAPDDSGHVVRVELPRTALASFGLPVNADRTEERVKADVLMGADGIARAIRFVR